jgi:hypothetical protein
LPEKEEGDEHETVAGIEGAVVGEGPRDPGEEQAGGERKQEGKAVETSGGVLVGAGVAGSFA